MYLLFKSIHLIAVVSWMVGLLYLPRIFVYHVESVENNKSEDLISTFKLMEKRLFIFIMIPAMILSWLLGLLLLFTLGFSVLSEPWMQLKLFLVLLLTLYHFYLGYCLKSLKFNQNTKTSKFFRIINEVPTLLLIIIVFIVVYKPII